MGEDGAYCFRTLTDKERFIPKDEWDSQRFGMICGQPQAYAEMKAALLKLCADSKRCDYETRELIRSFGGRAVR